MKSTHIARNLFAAALISVAGTAHAATEISKTIDGLGVRKEGSLGYFSTLEPGGAANCMSSLIHVDVSTDFGKAAFSYLLAGRIAGKKLKRFEYRSASDNICYLESLEIER
jgi:hypothetical protein